MINSAYCCHPLMDSMKNLIVASSSRLAMVEPLSLHPSNTTAFRNIKKMLCRHVFAMRDMLLHAITSSPFGIWRKSTLVAVAFCGQPRTFVLKADCCKGHTHREPGVRYGSDSALRNRGGGRCHPVIVVDTTTAMAPISAVDDVVASIVAKRDLAAFFFAQFFDCHRLLQYDVKKIRSLQSLLAIRRVKNPPRHRFSREWQLNCLLIAIRHKKYSVVRHRSLAHVIQWKKWIYCCSLIAIQHKKLSLLSLLAIWQKYALVSDGIKAKWLRKARPRAKGFAFGGHFDLLFSR
jgi:hypothetical protein